MRLDGLGRPRAPDRQRARDPRRRRRDDRPVPSRRDLNEARPCSDSTTTSCSLSSGASIGVVLLVALLLGLRHATDPDHIAAVTTLVASRQHASRAAARLGAFWGLGHAVTLVLFGLPILLFQQYLPERVQQGAETAVAVLIVFLAVRLLVRWRHGYFNLHAHPHQHAHHRHPCGRRSARSGSASSTAWAAAPASGSSSSPRSRRRRSRSRRSSCSRSSPPSR